MMRQRLMVPALLGVLLLAACGGGQQEPETPTPTGETPPPRPGTPAAAAEAERQRVEAEARAREEQRRRAEAETRQRAEAEQRTRAAAAAEEAARAREIIAEVVLFDFDKFNIRADQQPALQRKVGVLRANTNVRLRIEGHADERGSIEYNLALGMRRANSAREYLVGFGLEPVRFETVSFGEERPVCMEKNEDCWQRNRRNEFIIISGEVGRTSP
ncbi:MAG: OmpA family protein [Gemmatimonadetes bacterium]|nr:OmpA family protein [Gemmatimonadota bacterium]